MKPALPKGLSLQKKFILITSVTVVLLMTVVGLMFTSRERKIVYRNAERQGRLLAETLAIPIMNDLLYERLGFVEEGGLIDNYIAEIVGNKDIDLIYVAVLDEKGMVIAHNDLKEYGTVYHDTIAEPALSANATVMRQFVDEKSGHAALDFATPLSIGKKRFGTLRFAISLDRVEQEIQMAILKLLLVTFVFLVVALSVILILSRHFIKPITQLARAMERSGGDDLDIRVETRGGDEIAMLGQSFNSMIDRIRESNLQLKRTHTRLLQFARAMDKAGGDMLDVKVDTKDVKDRDEIAMLGQSFNRMIGRIRESTLELKQAHEKLLQSEKHASIGILAAGVAHEINNPLGGLFNCIQMLEQGKSEEFRKRYYRLLRDGLNRIETIVRKLLWMSRKDEKNPVPVNIEETLDDVYSFFEYKLKKTGIAFTRKVEEDLSMLIDPIDLQQILINLVINAIQSMKRGGVLKIDARRNGSKILVEVADSGEGIDQAKMSHIFDPFYTTKKPGEGTGLGLWLTYEIITNYNGDISVESEEGKGTKFILSFAG